MTLQMTTRYCLMCDRDTVHLRNGVNHPFHLIASILTGGLWLIVWLLVAGTADRRELCAHCSTPVGVSRTKAYKASAEARRVHVEVDPVVTGHADGKSTTD